MKPLYLLVWLSLLSSCAKEDNRLITIEEFPSNYIQSKTAFIYLPENYQNSDKHYPVLYMHDGSMLFDSTTTWNGQEWGVDEVMDKLASNGEIKQTIVVATSNGGNELRHPEYFPQKPFESLPTQIQDSLYKLKRSENLLLFVNPVQSDKYLQFIVEELKPYIDKKFRTLKEPEHTFIAGSSMGGLISMYAICEYPDVFGGAACLSTHWPGVFTTEDNPIPQAFFTYLDEKLPNPHSHLLYFDYGTETLDKLYEPYQLIADSIIASHGYNKSNFLTLKFEGHKHDEKSWNKRLDIPLTFLLAKK